MELKVKVKKATSDHKSIVVGDNTTINFDTEQNVKAGDMLHIMADLVGTSLYKKSLVINIEVMSLSKCEFDEDSKFRHEHGNLEWVRL